LKVLQIDEKLSPRPVIVAEGIEPTVETLEGGSGTRWGENVAPWDLEEAEEGTPEE
jgi:hypothetical protein